MKQHDLIPGRLRRSRFPRWFKPATLPVCVRPQYQAMLRRVLSAVPESFNLVYPKWTNFHGDATPYQKNLLHSKNPAVPLPCFVTYDGRS